MAKLDDLEAQRKRLKIHQHFWVIVGAVEHINIPKLEDTIRRVSHQRWQSSGFTGQVNADGGQD